MEKIWEIEWKKKFITLIDIYDRIFAFFAETINFRFLEKFRERIQSKFETTKWNADIGNEFDFVLFFSV